MRYSGIHICHISVSSLKFTEFPVNIHFGMKHYYWNKIGLTNSILGKKKPLNLFPGIYEVSFLVKYN